MKQHNWRLALYVATLLTLVGAGCKNDSSGGAAGSGGSATASGGTGSSAMPKAVATLSGFMGGTVAGAATFIQSGSDVTVSIALNNCVAGKMYPAHIHAGTSCADVMSQGDHWGPARGEGIPKIACQGTSGTATLTRKSTDTPDLLWSIGGNAATDVVGHVVVVHDPDVAMSPPRIACGLIQKQ